MAKSSKVENIKKLLRDQLAEIKRHMSSLGEEYQGRLKGVAELVGANTEQLSAIHEQVVTQTEQLDSIKQQVNIHTEQLADIKQDIEFIKVNLQRKVNYDEFSALSRRVSRLESKLK